MRRGSLHNAVKLPKNDILPLADKTLQQLKQKNPLRRNADPIKEHTIKSALIDAKIVRKATL